MIKKCCTLSSFAEMQVPLDVSVSPLGAESPVLSITHLQSAEIPLQSVGSVRDIGMCEIVEHVGQRVDDQAACTFEIAEHPSVFRCQFDFPAVALLPRDETCDPAVAGHRCADRGELQEQPPQLLRIGARGTSATPHQSLALDVYQAALKNCLGLTRAQRLQQPWLPVGGDAERVQPLPRQMRAIRPHGRGGLVDTQLPSNHSVGESIHEHRQWPATTARRVQHAISGLGDVCDRERLTDRFARPHDVLAVFFFFNDTATTEIYTLSLHDALPILERCLLTHYRGDQPTLVHFPAALFLSLYLFKILVVEAFFFLVIVGHGPRERRSEEHTSELQSH